MLVPTPAASDPVLAALRNAPLDDLLESEEERLAMAEVRLDARFVNHYDVETSLSLPAAQLA